MPHELPELPPVHSLAVPLSRGEWEQVAVPSWGGRGGNSGVPGARWHLHSVPVGQASDLLLQLSPHQGPTKPLGDGPSGDVLRLSIYSAHPTLKPLACPSQVSRKQQ